jgi:GNAT superfamily N-acetyltransferase
MRASASSIGPPSPLQNAIDNGTDEVPEGPLAGIPDLKTYVAETEVADGIAQTRQTANRILMFHPLNFGIFLAFIAFVGQYLYKSRGSDLGVVLTTSSGLIMAAMVTVRRYTNPYIALAEQTHISMLEDSDVLITKFGDEVMGTVIMGWVDAETKGKRRKWRAEIKGWAVRLRYRGKGEGMALLQEAVNLAKKKDADGISFAPDHASKCWMILTPFAPF